MVVLLRSRRMPGPGWLPVGVRMRIPRWAWAPAFAGETVEARMITVLVFLPLLAAVIAGIGNRFIGNTAAKLVTTIGLFASCALAWPIFIGFLTGHSHATVVPVLHWIHSGALNVDWSLRVDSLTAVMLVVVTSVSALVHLYSWGYMAEDDSQPRFFAYLSLFTFMMLMLVTADSLIQMFFGWEGVGLASYLLIGFWYYKPSANKAAIKAFVVNRVGDFGFSLGIFGTFLVFGTVSIPAILAAAPHMAGSTIGFLGYRLDTMTVLCLLLFVGAMGKSAQIGLHTWLPDAMEGPTPVSALIHAATMVTAGVFMVCRLSPMFVTSPVAMHVVTVIGAVTCFFAATVGTTQTDIKRVIAYSTCSQLGYMFFRRRRRRVRRGDVPSVHPRLLQGAAVPLGGLGDQRDAPRAGHALLWRAAEEDPGHLLGDGCGHARDHRRGIGGSFGFAGFYSKDAIIESAYASGTQLGGFAWFMGVFAALLTSFYSWRLIFLTFFGKPRWAASEHIQHTMHDAHGHDMARARSRWQHGHARARRARQRGACRRQGGCRRRAAYRRSRLHRGRARHAGLRAAREPVDDDAAAGAAQRRRGVRGLRLRADLPARRLLAGRDRLFERTARGDREAAVPRLLAPTIVMLIGLFVAWWAYLRDTSIPGRFTATFGGLYRFVLHKWYFDELYDFLFVRPAFAIGRFLWVRGDQGTIDHFGPDGIARLVVFGNRVTARVQSGYVYTYALVMLLGLAGVATWAVTR